MEKSHEHCRKAKDISLKELRDRLAEFARERGWEQYHSPRNLLLALVSIPDPPSSYCRWERWESCQRYFSGKERWKGDYQNWSSDDKEHLEEELSDVLLYLVQLADVCGLYLGQAALSKILKNAQKYPPSTTH